MRYLFAVCGFDCDSFDHGAAKAQIAKFAVRQHFELCNCCAVNFTLLQRSCDCRAQCVQALAECVAGSACVCDKCHCLVLFHLTKMRRIPRLVVTLIYENAALAQSQVWSMPLCRKRIGAVDAAACSGGSLYNKWFCLLAVLRKTATCNP